MLKQYVKAKPTKWGIKVFVLADANGHTVDFLIYGEVENIVGQRPVVQRGPVTGEGRSPGLQLHHILPSFLLEAPSCCQQGFGACGAYR